MSRWEREQADHLYENTVERPGPIIRSRVVNSEAVAAEATHELSAAEFVTCPTCGEVLPTVAAAYPEDGTGLM